MSLKNPTIPACILSSWPSTKSTATSSPIRQAVSLSYPTTATRMLLSSTSSKPMRLDPFPPRITPKKKFFVHIPKSTSGSHYAVSNLSYTNATKKHQRTLKRLLPWNTLASSTLPQTSIAQTLPNEPYAHGRIIFLLAWQASQNPSPSPTGATSQLNAMPHSTPYVLVVKILSPRHMKRSRGRSHLTPHP